jgi:hypothetical protein
VEDNKITENKLSEHHYQVKLRSLSHICFDVMHNFFKCEEQLDRSFPINITMSIFTLPAFVDLYRTIKDMEDILLKNAN